MFYDRQTCCLAVPMYKSGIYAITAYLAVQGLALAILTIATPNIIAVSVSNIGPMIFEISCFIFVFLQVIGIVAAQKDYVKLFRFYTISSLVIYVFTMVLTVVLIVISALNTSSTISACSAEFLQSASNQLAINTNLNNAGQTECLVFIGMELGVMGLSWIVLGIINAYFLTLSYHYGQSLTETRGDFAGMEKRYGDHNVAGDVSEHTPLSSSKFPSADQPWDPFSRYEKMNADVETSTPNNNNRPSLHKLNDPMSSSLNREWSVRPSAAESKDTRWNVNVKQAAGSSRNDWRNV